MSGARMECSAKPLKMSEEEEPANHTEAKTERTSKWLARWLSGEKPLTCKALRHDPRSKKRRLHLKIYSGKWYF